MIDNDLEGHWENVHSKKKENEVSWYQIYPKTSMDIIKSLNLIKSAHIIDVKQFIGVIFKWAWHL